MILRGVVVLLALTEAGWLAFDGAHALATGDYVTPDTGEYAGKLGPWSTLVSAAGLEPRSTLVMSIHLALGAVWLGVIAAYVVRARWSRGAMIGCAAAAFWYLPFGTLLSVVQIVLLTLRRGRDA